ncbi:MAG: trypsin-like serine protease [Bacteroidia bacterium]
MKIFHSLPLKPGLLFLSLIFFFPFFISAQRESVVLIHTEGGSGYGVVWGKNDQIVTALHLVAGRNKIQVTSSKNEKALAHVVKTLKDSDLALLHLNTPLNLPPTQTSPGDPPTDIDINYWERKVGTTQMDIKTTRLQKSTTLEKIDPRLIQDPQEKARFSQSLCSDGSANYPSMKADIIKFAEKNINKAHSGSPITRNNKVIGIVDGGNKPSSVWAIPAAEFSRLLSEGTTVSPPSCSSDRLYSGLRSDNPFLDEESKQQALEIEQSQNLQFGSATLSLSFNTDCEDYYATLTQEEQGRIVNMVKNFEKEYPAGERLTAYDLYPQLIRIFQDASTGATLAIPSGATIGTFEEDGHSFIKITTPGEGTVMYVYLAHYDSIEACWKDLQWFRRYLVNYNFPWNPEVLNQPLLDSLMGLEPIMNLKSVLDYKAPVNYTKDTEDPYYAEDVEWVTRNFWKKVTGRFYANMLISDTDFMGVVVQTRNWQSIDEDKNERITSYLMEACARIMDFPFY